MNWRPSTVVGATAALLATWLVRTSTSLGPSSPTSAPPPQPSTSSAVVPAVDRLREHLASPIAPIASGRNLFEFRRPDAAPPASPSPPPAPAAAPSPPVRFAPPMTLIGLAADEGPDGPVRTAIILARGDLHLARVGDVVASGLRVASIGDDRVELAGAPDEPRVVLTLK